MPGTWVTAASRCTFLLPPALAPLRSFPSTATPWRAGTCPGSPVTADRATGGPGAAGTSRPGVPPGRPLRPAASASCSSAVLPARAAVRAVRGIRSRDRRVERERGHRPGQGGLELVRVQQFASLSSIDADGATRSPVRGLVQQPCAASTSWPQPCAACATASGPEHAAATPATSTDTSDDSGCRFPRAFRKSVSRPSSDSRNDTGSSAVPAGKRQRTSSVSHDEGRGAVKWVLA